MRCAVWNGTLPRSMTTSPKPPLCSSRSVTRRACSTAGAVDELSAFFSFSASEPALSVVEGCLRGEFFERESHRTHSNLSKFTPAAAADAGSNISLVSTSAQASCRSVAAAKAASSTLVLPDEAAPQISLKHPRGQPPVSASSSRTPLETMSGAGRTSSRDAGVTCASAGRAGIRSPLGGFPEPGAMGLPSATEKSGIDDMRPLNFRERQGGVVVLRGDIRFLFAFKIVLHPAWIVKRTKVRGSRGPGITTS